MFPVYNAPIPHSNSHGHPHAHPHSSHNHTTRKPLGAHPDSSAAASQSSTMPEPAPQTAASTLPLYSSYQLQQRAGYLHKEGDVWKTWKKRYFVLSSQLLSYYTDREATTPKGHIQLQGAEVRVSQRSDRKWLFEVFREEAEAEHRVYYLAADSEAERGEWMAAIKYNILYELNRTRALVDTVDSYKVRIAQLTDELERHRATQILADLNKPRTTPPQQQQPDVVVTTSLPTAPSQPVQPAAASVVAMHDRLGYLEAEVARLLAENQSLKRSALAMDGKGDEVRPTAETHKDEVATEQQQPTAAASAAAPLESTGPAGSSGGGGQESELEQLRKEVARVRMERSILKREVLRLMKVNEELTHSHPAASASTSAKQPPPTSSSAVQ